MGNREVAVQLSGVKKQYRLGQIGGGTLQKDLQSWWAKVRKKEDPNLKIGQEQRLVGESFMALNGIDLTIYKGEAVGIIGGNGAGKSTLLKLLSRVTAPSEGTIDLYGRVASMLEVGTGFNGEMTGRENVYMNGAILGMTKDEIDRKMEDIIEFSEVRDFIDTPVKRYSSGMYVKLAFSVAAHLDSEIMIMDEVLAVGDMAFQKKCLDKMKEAAAKEGRTVLYVSHNMNTIRQLCDRCIVLDKGKIVFQGDVDESIQRYMSTSKALLVENRCDYERNKGYGLNGDLLIDKIVFINKEYPVYGFGENVKLEISYISKKRFLNVAFRLSILNVDRMVIGQATSKPCVDVNVGFNSTTISFDVNSLAPGKYIIKVVVYSVNEYGGNNNMDIIEEACAFEKIQNGENNNMAWNHNWWGYLMFPELEIVDDCANK